MDRSRLRCLFVVLGERDLTRIEWEARGIDLSLGTKWRTWYGGVMVEDGGGEDMLLILGVLPRRSFAKPWVPSVALFE